MNVVGNVNAFDKGRNKDVFGNTGYATDDHIWPSARGGSNSSSNIQQLTQSSNSAKSDDLTGSVNDVRFAINPAINDANGNKVGVMYVTSDNHNWYRVVNY